jgi:hypothetical protein
MRDHLRHAACTDNKNVFFIKLGLTYVQWTILLCVPADATEVAMQNSNRWMMCMN